MKNFILIAVVIALIVAGFTAVKSRSKSTATVPTPTEEPLLKLSPDQLPKISLNFNPNGHFVTVNMTNLHASALEYNLVYEAVVKKTKIQTGVSATTKLEGSSTYSKEQLLGSESSGKFTYHNDIKNGMLELTLRDSAGRSIFTTTYPFTHAPGKSVDLVASE